MPTVVVNVPAIIVAALISMAIGAVWYSPLLFAKPWLHAIGKRNDDMARQSPIYLIVLLTSLLEAYVLAHFVSYAVALSALDGARIGLWLVIGIVIPVVASVCLFESKGLKWFLITLGYQLLSLMSMGAVLAMWMTR